MPACSLPSCSSLPELQLAPAWTYDAHDSLKPAARGKRPALEATPVYDQGRLYISTPWGTVAALDATTGKQLWRTDLRINPAGDYGDFVSRGVSLRPPFLYTGTVDGRLVCLSMASGKHCPKFGTNGKIDLTAGLRRRPKYVGECAVTSEPAIIGDLVITGSAIADNSRLDMASGEVRAFDTTSG